MSDNFNPLLNNYNLNIESKPKKKKETLKERAEYIYNNLW